jgi:hypothetical protein
MTIGAKVLDDVRLSLLQIRLNDHRHRDQARANAVAASSIGYAETQLLSGRLHWAIA